jgi:predicted nucleic acid-binding protein
VIVVSDTSAITSLLVIRRVDLLQKLFHQVLIPSAVAAELHQTHPRLPGFIREVAVDNLADVTQFLGEVDRGEAEAIALAKQVRADALLIDEKVGRRLALRVGLKVVGLLGVLTEAKRNGLIPALAPVMQELEGDAGFYISPELRQKILKTAGEV